MAHAPPPPAQQPAFAPHNTGGYALPSHPQIAPVAPAPGAAAPPTTVAAPASSNAGAPPRQTSFFAKVQRSMTNIGNEALRGVGVASRMITTRLTETQFQALFQLPVQEHLLAEQPCKALTQQGSIDGSLFVTAKHVCFHATAPHKVAVIVAFKDIIKVQLGQYRDTILPNGQKGVAEVVAVDGTTQEGLADVIQVFDKNKVIHQFTALTDFPKFAHLLRWLYKIEMTYEPPL